MDATSNISEQQPAAGQAQRRRIHAQIPDDKTMLRAAAELTRDINTARPEIYWPDMIISALVGYAALAGAILVDSTWQAIVLGVISTSEMTGSVFSTVIEVVEVMLSPSESVAVAVHVMIAPTSVSEEETV